MKTILLFFVISFLFISNANAECFALNKDNCEIPKEIYWFDENGENISPKSTMEMAFDISNNYWTKIINEWRYFWSN